MKFIFLFPLFFFFFTKNDNNLKCSNFKTGKFELVNSESNRKYIIERNSEFQTEDTYNLETGEKISGPRFYKIKWKSDCEYNLLIDTTKSKYDETDLYMNSKGGLNSKILKIENDCATVTTNFEEMNIETKICKIK
jgi:hypothetical protein